MLGMKHFAGGSAERQPAKCPPLAAMKLALLALLLASGSAAAQSPLLVSPDTLFYPREDVVTLTNVSAAAVSLDSIAMAIGSPRAYDVEFVMPDSTYGPYYLNSAYETSFDVGEDLEAGDSALLRILGFDPCTVCFESGVWLDSLLFYADGDATPVIGLVDLTTYVAAEPDPLTPEQFRLTAHPNPASGEITLHIEAAGTAGVEVAVFDVLGRVVERQWLAPEVAPEITLRTERFSPGTYHVVASTPDGRKVAQAFTVIR